MAKTMDLLLEIGTEEIPARFIPRALEDLAATARAALESRRLTHGKIRTFGTPRRLTLAVARIVARQPDLELEVTGPPKKAAYDESGALTKAGQGFAKGQGVDEKDLYVKATPKGEYLAAVRREAGRDAADILREEVPGWITGLRFQKSMRWGSGDLRFVRPLHWVVALLGGEVLAFELEGIKAGNRSRGHRFLAPKEFAVRGLADYLAKTRKAFVVADPAERKETIRAQVAAAAAEKGGRAVIDEELLEHVTNLVEWPVAISGGFEPEFLAVPAEVLVTAMKAHQKYFTVVDTAGKLLPWFVTVSNMQAPDMGLIRAGNERVLRARLSDARFFWESDLKIPLRERVASLGSVVYQEKLGTYREKVERVKELARFVARETDGRREEDAERAAVLSKADLVTGMVGEFPELQGVMGRHYALASGEKPEVAEALLEAYLPRFAGDALPASELGAILSVAERLDTIAAIFGIGLAPTGSEDPYALRRHTLAVINILAERCWPLHLKSLVELAIATLTGKLIRPAEGLRVEVLEFFRGRLENLYVSGGAPVDIARAVLAAGFDRIPEVGKRIAALDELRKLEDFAALAVTFKRVANIVPPGFAGEIDAALCTEPVERDLAQAASGIRADVDAAVWERDYLKALRKIAELRPVVDRFFDGVLVMAGDPKARTNRLALLAAVQR
ncbi:MAG TPA: glycine--tRNA ligase subunit beta, partial [Candidatus Methanoperedens sp.]|nr:glycine--tRNA ligase subunit beta [Candidatus Methanoperedens sp.]